MTSAQVIPRSDQPREIWHSDFLVDSSVLGCAAVDRRLYERLACQLHKMTAKPEYGRAWIPSTAVYEMAATPDPKRRDVLGVILNLFRELGDRILLTGTLDETIAAEWAEPPHAVSRSLAALESDLVACTRGRGAGTLVDLLGRDFAEWRRKKRAEYAEWAKKFTSAYASEEKFRESISAVLAHPWTAEAHEICDDVAGQLI